LPFIGKKTLELSYDTCTNAITISIDSLSKTLDLDKPIEIATGFSIQATDHKTDTSCSTYDMVSMNLVLLGPLSVQLLSIPLQFPVGATSCSSSKWIIYVAIAVGVALLLLVLVSGGYKYQKKKAQQEGDKMKVVDPSTAVVPTAVVLSVAPSAPEEPNAKTIN
jgi:hypothetical protein